MIRRALALAAVASVAAANKPELPPMLPIYFGTPSPVDAASGPAYFAFRARAHAPVTVTSHRDDAGSLGIKLYRRTGNHLKLLVEKSVKQGDDVVAMTLKEAGDYVAESVASGDGGYTVTLGCASANVGDCAEDGQPGAACRGPKECADGLLCRPASGCAGPGTCVVRPRFCPLGILCRTNCGCDGRIYCNACEAERAGTFVAHVGACTNQGCGGVVGCGGGDFCQLPVGNCGAGNGRCAARPSICTKEYRPVCGCDGKTYGNVCEAAAAGQSVAANGACGGETACATAADCRGFLTQLCRPCADGTTQCTSAAQCGGPLPNICQVCGDGQSHCAHWACNAGKCVTEVCPPAKKGCATAADCQGILPKMCQGCSDGQQHCAHFVCVRGNCAIEVCPP